MTMIHDQFSVNEKGHLAFAGRDTVALAEKYGTPLFVMNEERIRARCRLYKQAMTSSFGADACPLFASKSISFRRIYEIMREEEMGIDVVSAGEICTAAAAGFPMENAYFHGNNKTDADIALAMEKGVGCFVCDHADELRALSEAATARKTRQKILLRITPGIDPHTHAAVATGKVDSKFGAAIETGQAEELVRLALSLPALDLRGYHCHIGSQIFDIAPFRDAANIMLDFCAHIRGALGYEAKELNLGGGMGVPYTEDDPEIDYAKNIREIAECVKAKCAALALPMPAIRMEPGRSMVADAGITLYTVGSKKEIPGYKNYVSVDGGMTDNPRYALYASRYTALIANRAGEEKTYPCTIAGRCCESGDLLGEEMMLQPCARGDILAVLVTGAYNFSMASNYNRIPRPPVVMLNEDGEYVAVRRESFDDLLRNDL